jgi:hypothetical protein
MCSAPPCRLNIEVYQHGLGFDIRGEAVDGLAA